MAKKAKKTNGSPRPKQPRLEGMEEPRISEIDAAAHNYVSARNDWQRMHQPMMEAQDILHNLMRKHDLKYYAMPDDEEEVVVAGKEKVVVRKMKTVEAS